jgi:hypothetical protein
MTWHSVTPLPNEDPRDRTLTQRELLMTWHSVTPLPNEDPRDRTLTQDWKTSELRGRIQTAATDPNSRSPPTLLQTPDDPTGTRPSESHHQ